MRRLFKFIGSRFFLGAFCILLEFAQLLAVYILLYKFFLPITILAWIFHFGVLLYLINRDEIPEFKMPWLIILFLLPVIGSFIFMLLSSNSTSRKEYARSEKAVEDMRKYHQQTAGLDELKAQDSDAWLQANYLYGSAGMPCYGNTKTTYYPIGEDFHMMPGIDGFEFAQTVRKLNEDIPILFMTARDDFASKQRGYRIGIDDYMIKPIDLDELFLRIGALLRRAKIASSHRLEIGRLVLDADERTAVLDNEEIPLTAREFNILYKLLSYPKKTFTRSQLMDEFWETESNTAPRAVDVYMTKLRDKFSGCDDFEIVTVHGLGYKAVMK